MEWDAVELPSQFMENWCYEPAVLRQLCQHIDSEEPLSDDLIQRVVASRSFHAGLSTLAQLRYALLDMELHTRMAAANDAPIIDAEALKRLVADVSAKTSVLPPLEKDAFICSFKHIFAGGYAAGYYSYKFAEGECSPFSSSSSSLSVCLLSQSLSLFSLSLLSLSLSLSLSVFSVL